ESNRSTFGERLLECVYLCDWISYYLAILNKKDPGEIDFIHHLKKKMSEV
ncbi:MAG TPA: SIS domain-containing protein, partial [Spirochaetota bacterium]|nr:SIS domain-containing protein [Spirochaetota bacterium]